MRHLRQAATALLLGGAMAALALASTASAQVARQPARDIQYEWSRLHPQMGEFKTIPLRPFNRVTTSDGQIITESGVFVIQGPDGNVTVFIGPEGVFVVDSQRRELGERLIAELDKLRLDRPIRVFVTTSGDPERAGAGGLVRDHGEQITGNTASGGVVPGAIHMSHENVLLRLAGANGRDAAVDEAMWPKFAFTETYDFFFNGEGVQLIHAPSAHTDGDSFVLFRRSDVIAAGDLWDTTGYPRIDRARGGSINGVIAGLTRIIDQAVSGPWQEGGTLIVPGRGRVGDESEIVEYRDMLTIIRDRIKAMADRGMTLQQVKAQRPTFDFDGRYGAAAGPWTSERFVEAVYEGVRPQRRGRAAR